MNYRELLKRYMLFIRGEEGVTFVDMAEWPDGDIQLTADEITELRQIESELP